MPARSFSALFTGELSFIFEDPQLKYHLIKDHFLIPLTEPLGSMRLIMGNLTLNNVEASWSLETAYGWFHISPWVDAGTGR